MKKSKTNDVIIIGGGPAGIACAIQLKRCGIVPLVIEKNNFGGQLMYANLVENYPGFPGGINGKNLVKKLDEHFISQGLSCLHKEVLDIKYCKDHFKVITGNNLYAKHSTIKTEYIVIASGTKPKLLKDFDIKPSLSNSISYGISGLTDIKNRKFVIAGAGDLAFDYSLNLGKRNEVTILNRSNMPKCLPLLFERAGNLKRFTYVKNAFFNQAERFGKDKLRIKFKTKSGNCSVIADYLVFAIGRVADIDFVNDEFKKKIKLLSKLGKLYFIGDAANSQCRQTAIATGDGIKAAMHIYEKIRGSKLKEALIDKRY